MDDAPAGVPELGNRNMTLSGALAESLAAMDVDPRDAALGALLAVWARELDGAAAVAARAAQVARDVAREHGQESALYERVAALEAALSRRTALATIGARFHAGLIEVLGTPRSRGAGKAGMPPERRPAGPSPLGVLRLASGDDG